MTPSNPALLKANKKKNKEVETVSSGGRKEKMAIHRNVAATPAQDESPGSPADESNSFPTHELPPVPAANELPRFNRPRIIIGVDSRSTTSQRAEQTPEVFIYYWTGDNHKKFDVIVAAGQHTPCVCMTLCGSTSRLADLKGFLNGLTCRVYMIGDRQSMVGYISSVNYTQYGAIGSGYEVALEILWRVVHMNPLVHGEQLVSLALRRANHEDVRTGGMLRVYLIQGTRLDTYPSPTCLRNDHRIDLLIRNFLVDVDSLFFFSASDYTIMNKACKQVHRLLVVI